MSTCESCGRNHGGKVYSGDRCPSCYRRDLRISRGLPVRTDIVSRVQARLTVDENGCHIFDGWRNKGYGRIGAGPRGSGYVYTHRLMYEAANGPIPDGLHIDHLCRNRSCCNPDHLEAVTQAENNRRAATAKYSGRTADPERRNAIEAEVAALEAAQ